MSQAIPEADWKLLRQLQPAALERFCQRVLSEVERIAADAGQTNHERYLALHELMRRRDKELADAFDYLRRSTAIFQLARMRSLDLVTDDELSRFSPETRDAVGALAALRRG